jgi:hypothetical protein
MICTSNPTRGDNMHWLDIFYLTLVVTAFTGFALTLAYFFHWAGPAQSGSAQVDSPAKPASARAKPKAPIAERILEHA